MDISIKLDFQIRQWLKSPRSYYHLKSADSIMHFDDICTCDDGFMCEHRIDKLIKLLEEHKQ